MLTVTLKNDAKTKWSIFEGYYEHTPDLQNGLPKWKKMDGPHEIEPIGNMWYIRQDGTNSKFSTQDQSHAIDRMPDDSNYKWKMFDGSNWAETASGDVKIRGTL